MKKAFLFAVISMAALLLGACGSSNSGDDSKDTSTSTSTSTSSSSSHEHTFSDKWSYDNTYHWHEATCGHDVTKDKEKHDYDETIIPATYETTGKTVYTCKVCDYSYEEIIPVLEHHYSNEWSHDETHHYHACTDEGYESLRSDEEEHKFSEWNITLAPTISAAGSKERECSVCEYKQVEEIPQLVENADDLVFSLENEGTEYYVTGVIEHDPETHPIKNIVIPAEYNGLPVTKIEQEAFSENYEIEFAYIPGSVTKIDIEAFFSCANLIGVTLNEGLTSIGASAFASCINLKHIDLPQSLTSMDTFAFASSGLEEVVLPDNISYLGYWNPFINCQSLKVISLADSNSYFTGYNGAIYSKDCKTLFAYPSGADTFAISYLTETINDNACTGLSKITNLSIPSDVQTIGYGAFQNSPSIEKISFGTNLKTIESNAFTLCTSLKSLSFNNNLEVIKDKAFTDCHSLETVNFGQKLNNIGENVFWNCDSLKTFSVNSTNTKYYVNNSALCAKTTILGTENRSIIAFPNAIEGEVTIASNITGIRSDFVDTCRKITSFKVETSNATYKSVDGVLYHKSSNTLVRCPEGRVDSVTIESGCITIGQSAFYDCRLLKEVNIPYTIENIEGWAFYNCESLTAINYDSIMADFTTYVTLGGSWHLRCAATVIHCTDGDLAI